MHPLIHRLKSKIPFTWLQPYHLALAYLASWYYRYPSRELIVIGVTGTNGKTTTSYLIAKALEASGFKTGCTSTALMKVADKEWLNTTKMTMPGRFYIQRMLREMVKAGCRYVVVETSSQGLVQYRHMGVDYDVAVLTNLTPEHIEAHGGFENYKKAKRMLFEHLTRSPKKVIDGKEVKKVAVINADSPHGEYYASTPGLSDVTWYGIDSARGVQAMQLELRDNGSSFQVDGQKIESHLTGRFNVENMLAALTVCKVLGIDLLGAAAKLGEVTHIPGRVERVDEGQPWTVIVDYAAEPEAVKRLYEAFALIPHKRIIHVFGSCGGGRDVARQPILGRLAAEHVDIVIVTNEDPYDDDPQQIIDHVAKGAEAGGKKLGENLFKITDRREAMMKAMRMAEPGDLVVMTGKGCEPWMCVADGKKLPWDEVQIAREAIRAALAKRG